MIGCAHDEKMARTVEKRTGSLEPAQSRLASAGNVSIVLVAAELLVLSIWTLYVLRDFLNLDPLEVPYGREFFTAIHSHFAWDRIRECGTCGMWNGSYRGGYPAFVDPLGAMLFPPVIVSSLLWGAVNGAKVALVMTLFIAGFAQWWLGRVVGVGTVARVWSAGMAIAAGGLAGRMQDGGVPIVTSTAACMLVIPAAIHFARTGTRRSTGILGASVGAMLVAGQGYLQIAFALMSPLFLLFLISTSIDLRRLCRRFALGIGIGLLIAAPFLVPLLHFYSSFDKFTDPTFAAAQPPWYVPMNLVIDDYGFYESRRFHMLGLPYLYINYLGWIAVALAAIGCLALWRRRDLRTLIFLVGWSLGAMWISSAMPLMWVRDLITPGSPVHEFAISMRSTPIIAGLAIPSILALSAIGVESVMRMRLDDIRSLTEKTRGRLDRIDLRWVLVIPLLLALRSEETFARNYLQVMRQPVEEMAPVLDALRTSDLQWISVPFGEEYWMGQAEARNLKLATLGRVWLWRDRSDPKPVIEAIRIGAPPPGATQTQVLRGVRIYESSGGNEFATAAHADGTHTVCVASGVGGNIDVECNLPRPGRVEIKENHYSGWKATSGGNSVPIEHPDGWMVVDLPAGRSKVELRYRPWDVPVGITLMVVGLALAVWCVVLPDPVAPPRP